MSGFTQILLVDDSAAHRKLMKRALERAGLRLHYAEADSVASGCALLEGIMDDDPPRLAIIDYHLGDGDGTTVITAIRQHAFLGAVPIIAVSTSALEDDRSACLRCGATEYVTKSDDLSALAELVSRSLRS